MVSWQDAQRAIYSDEMKQRRGSAGRPQPQSPYERSKKQYHTKQNDIHNEKERLLQVAETILTLDSVDDETAALIGKSQNYTLHPNLALWYFYRLGLHPDAFVYNDEDVNDEQVIDRIMKAIGPPVGQEDLERCQTSARQRDPGSERMAACASCNEIIYGNDVAETVSISKLSSAFQLTKEQLSKMKALPEHLVDKHVSVLHHCETYFHLNPDLVHSTDAIVLCKTCHKDPFKHRFSLCNGHDYGRLGDLPALNDSTLNAILPARAYNIEIMVRKDHSKAHVIAFLSDGPVQVSKTVPNIDPTRKASVQVTFIGPQESWRKKAGKYRALYAIDTDAAYEYLAMWKGLKNPYFDDVQIDESLEMLQRLQAESRRIEDSIIFSIDPDIQRMAKHADDDSDDDHGTCSQHHSCEHSDSPMEQSESACTAESMEVTYSAVLPRQSLLTGAENGAVKALLKIVQPGSSDEEEQEEEESGATHDDSGSSTASNAPANQSTKPTPVVIQREAEPIVEWDENDKLLGAVFPMLFMLGKGLPKGSIPRDQLEHIAKFYDGRFDRYPLFMSTAFNQLQRHSCVRSAARLGVKKKSQLEHLGKLCNSKLFQERLKWAQNNPMAPEAKKLNATVCHIVSMVGGTVPFSPFERSASRPKMNAMKLILGPQSHFVTAAPPEFEDIATLRHALLTENINDPSNKIAHKGFTRNDLPTAFRENTSVRLRAIQKRPSLAALFYDRQLKTLTNDILQCPPASETRFSRDYSMRQQGAYQSIAGFHGVTEAQKGGRLHFHTGIYVSALTPALLTVLAAVPRVHVEIQKILDSITCTHLRPGIRQWYENVKAIEDTEKQPRAADIIVPDVAKDFDGFIEAGQKQAALVGHHVHGFTCEKPPKGLTRCRLSMPRGVHETETAPLVITLEQRANDKLGTRAKVTGAPLDDLTKQMLANSLKPLEGHLIREHTAGPVVWELKRPETDKLLVEFNLCITNLLRSHNNSSPITGIDAALAVEEYLMEYMTKEGAGLRHASAIMLAQLEHAQSYPSKADDSGTNQRQGMYIATRTVHKFVGCHEWSYQLMWHALLGNTSFVTSASFRYIYPWAAIAYIQDKPTKDSLDKPSDDCCAPQPNNDSFDETEEGINEALRFLCNGRELNQNTDDAIGGATAYKLWDGSIVYLTQAESYDKRGPMFEAYSYMDFECIVELRRKTDPKKSISVNEKTSMPKSAAGRPTRPGFPLDKEHLLYEQYEGVIRAKMRLAIPAGHQIPIFPGNKPKNAEHQLAWVRDMTEFAKYAMIMLVPWHQCAPSHFSFDAAGLAQMIHEYNHSQALPHLKMRYRILLNFMQMRHRSSHNEETANIWRGRNTQYWKDIHEHMFSAAPYEANGTENESADPEAAGKLSTTELARLTNAFANPDMTLRRQTQQLVKTCNNLWGTASNTKVNDENTPPEAYIYSSQPSLVDVAQASSTGEGSFNRQEMSCKQMIDAINKMHLLVEDPNVSPSSEPANISTAGPSEAPSTSDPTNAMPVDLSDLNADQRSIVEALVDQTQQHLIMMHGGGGVGKTFVIRKLDEIIHRRGGKVLQTCTTGVGAGNLPKGRTIDSAFSLQCKEINANRMTEEMWQRIGAHDLQLVVIDEVSMMSIDSLVTIDARLRSMYDPLKAFGGKSILLSGDFLQMPTVTHGQDLYRVFYSEKKQTAMGSNAVALFQSFRVVQLTQQMRAAHDPNHCERLEEFRVLPTHYPAGQQWSGSLDDAFRPITEAILDSITQPLQASEIHQNEDWITKSTVITTNNRDRAIINAVRAEIIAEATGKKALRWQRQCIRHIPLCMHALLYSSDDYPELFAYAVVGAPAMILDNGNGNVLHGVSNGTKCTIVGLAWDDDAEREAVIRLIKATQATVVDLPSPPDYIIVCVDGVHAKDWPRELNLAPYTSDGAPTDVYIPIGLNKRKKGSLKCNDMHVLYDQHAVDLAFAITVWKVQGGTFDYIIVLLEPCKGGKRFTFEMLYVSFSRVRKGSQLRCMPLSPMFQRSSLKKLRPEILATRWRKDIGPDGFWNGNPLNTQASSHHEKRSTQPCRCPTQMRARSNIHKRPILHISTKSDVSGCGPSKRLCNRQATVTKAQQETTTVPCCAPANATQLTSGQASLQPHQWVTDGPITYFGEALVAAAAASGPNDITYFDTYTYTLFIGPDRKLPHGNTSLVRSARLHNKLWLIPINDSNTHWMLLLIVNATSPDGAVMILLDSCRPNGQPSLIQSAVFTFGETLLQHVRPRALRTASISHQQATTPGQTNGNDCGIHVIMSMDYAIQHQQELCTIAAEGSKLQADQWYTEDTVVAYRANLFNSYGGQ